MIEYIHQIILTHVPKFCYLLLKKTVLLWISSTLLYFSYPWHCWACLAVSLRTVIPGTAADTAAMAATAVMDMAAMGRIFSIFSWQPKFVVKIISFTKDYFLKLLYLHISTSLSLSLLIYLFLSFTLSLSHFCHFVINSIFYSFMSLF